MPRREWPDTPVATGENYELWINDPDWIEVEFFEDTKIVDLSLIFGFDPGRELEDQDVFVETEECFDRRVTDGEELNFWKLPGVDKAKEFLNYIGREHGQSSHD